MTTPIYLGQSAAMFVLLGTLLASTPTLARAQDVTLVSGSGAEVMQFSPDGKLFAANHLLDVMLWDVKTRRQIATLKDKGASGPLWMDFSPDSSLLVCGPGLCVWNVRDRKLHWLPKDVDPIVGAFLPDGTYVVFDGKKTQWFDLANRRITQECPCIAAIRRPFARSPDGKQLATATEQGTMFIWETQTGRMLHHFNQRVRNFAYSPDSSMLLVEDRFYQNALQTATFQPVEKNPFPKAAKEVQPVPSRDNTIAFLYYQGFESDVFFRDLSKQKTTKQFHTNKVIERMCVSPDGKIVAAVAYPMTKDLKQGRTDLVWWLLKD